MKAIDPANLEHHDPYPPRRVRRLQIRWAAVPAHAGSIDGDHSAALEAYILDNERWNGWSWTWQEVT